MFLQFVVMAGGSSSFSSDNDDYGVLGSGASVLKLSVAVDSDWNKPGYAFAVLVCYVELLTSITLYSVCMVEILWTPWRYWVSFLFACSVLSLYCLCVDVRLHSL